MEPDAAPTTCPNCERLQLRVRSLEAAVAALAEQVRVLQDKLAAASKDSSTSSKPPSSDVVKPPKPAPPAGQSSRTKGGQPGHPRHLRSLIPPDQVNAGFFDHSLSSCPDCGHSVQPLRTPPRVSQHLELPSCSVLVQQHHCHPAFCPACRKVHFAPLPDAAAGLVGPRLTALVAYLKGVCHASFSTVRLFLRDVVGVRLCRGHLAKVIGTVSDALRAPYEELLRLLPGEAVLNVDETSHKDDGDLMWTWCFRASLFTLFRIDPARSADVLLEVLGREFDGVLGCDHFGAYRRYMRECDVRVQFCLAHLIREVKYLTTLPTLEDVVYGTRLLTALEGLFGVIHRRESMSGEEFGRELEAARDGVLAAGMRDEGTENSRRMAKRMREYGREYFTFVTTPGVEATNNVAERAIRFVVIDRLITQGTRGEKGQRWSERMWTVMATCVQQGRSVWEFLSEAVRTHLAGEPGPSLVPQAG